MLHYDTLLYTDPLLLGSQAWSNSLREESIIHLHCPPEAATKVTVAILTLPEAGVWPRSGYTCKIFTLLPSFLTPVSFYRPLTPPLLYPEAYKSSFVGIPRRIPQRRWCVVVPEVCRKDEALRCGSQSVVGRERRASQKWDAPGDEVGHLRGGSQAPALCC